MKLSNLSRACGLMLVLLIKASITPSAVTTNTWINGLRQDFYFNIPGMAVSNLLIDPRFPSHPDATSVSVGFETPMEYADNYGVRLSGYLIPPVSGEYVFYICSDDQSVLYLSSGTSPSNKVAIARDTSWSIYRDWTSSQGEISTNKRSAPVYLSAGQWYYVEALMKEGGGGDFLAVTWQLPGAPPPNLGDPPISNDYLRCTLNTNQPPVESMVVTVTANRPVATESAYSLTNYGSFSFHRQGLLGNDLLVSFQVGGTAVNARDYEWLTNVIYLAAGQTNAELLVRPINDDLSESNKTVTVTLIPDQFRTFPYRIGYPSNATVTIIDDDLITTNRPPLVTLLTPTNGTQYPHPQIIHLLAEATDPDGTVQTVDFYSQGTNFLGHGIPLMLLSSAPMYWPGTNYLDKYVVVWTNPPVGIFRLTAKAVDNKGAATVSSPAQIGVGLGSSVITILQPTNNQAFIAPTNITINAEAMDPQGYISRLEFYDRTNLIGVSELVFFRTPYPGEVIHHTWVWKNVSVGQHLLTARSKDTIGANVVSSPVAVKVQSLTNAFAVKRMLPAVYQSGAKLTVKLRTTAAPGDHAYAIEDQPPVGWQVGAISHEGVFDAQNLKVKFGPFFGSSALPELLTYDVTPPKQETGVKTFNGLASMDGVLIPIAGQQTIKRLSLLTHPADLNPTNYSIAMNELTAYVQAWQKGSTWPVDPNPIPSTFVSRAIGLWRNGESYRYEASLEPPACWISLTNIIVPLSSAGFAEQTFPDSDTAIRTLPASVLSGHPCTVLLSIAPGTPADGYVVEEQIPSGWLVRNITDGGQFDATAGKVKWAFFNGTPHNLGYELLTPANASGQFDFIGTAVIAAADNSREITIGGSSTLLVTTAAAEPKPLHIERAFAASARITLNAPAGQPCQIEYSTDLVHWIPLTTFTPTVSPCHFLDNDAQPETQRFYRLRSP